ncbi:MAG: hypothetical protein K9L30_07540 [Desulfobacterales bacterium]|nr:hypothetical protein [Desulfobacterales bacterium]
MKNKINYRCEVCGQNVEIVDGKINIPECCKRQMVKVDDLDFCEKPSDQEFARLYDNDGPCDDGRRGKI